MTHKSSAELIEQARVDRLNAARAHIAEGIAALQERAMVRALELSKAAEKWEEQVEKMKAAMDSPTLTMEEAVRLTPGMLQ